MIDISNVTFSYSQNKKVLDQLSFRITEGQIVGMLGPNGSGKTTITRLILGLLQPESGGIFVTGLNPVLSPKEVKRLVGVVHQNCNFDSQLSVYDNLDIYGAFHGLDRTTRARRVRGLMEEFELNAVRNRVVQDLSGGEQRRVQVARALLHSPKLLLLDEPSANMDIQWRSRLQEKIVQRSRSDGATVLWTSHDMNEIEQVADRVLLLDAGHIVGDDAPRAFALKLTGEYVRLKAHGTPDVPEVPEVSAWRREGDWLVFHVDSAELRLPIIMRHLLQAGIDVTSVQIEKATLDRAFREFLEGRTRK